MKPRTLFGRIALVIALVSIGFSVFTIAVISGFALVPLGRIATHDLAALMVGSAQAWNAADTATRATLQDDLERRFQLQLRDPADPTNEASQRAPALPSVRLPAFRLPYFHLLESALTQRTGTPVSLRHSRGADNRSWYWADLPTEGEAVRVVFAADRVAVQPSLALIIVMGVGAVVALVTAAMMAHWLIQPLARLVNATQPIGQGRRPAALPETGPRELAVLAREFNRMGAQVEELLANRTTMLTGISHDLRSPLTRIRLALGMLSEKPDTDLLGRIVRDVDGMNDLISRSLDVGRDFSERESVEVDLGELLARIASDHDHGGVEIRTRQAPGLRLRIRPLALKRIVSNLVGNAIRYGERQPVDIDVKIGAGAVEICVLDRGPGIPEDAREAMFRPFHRLETSRDASNGGSGLGLAIVRQIASANGWSVALGQRPGGGTAACVRVPLEQRAAAAAH